MLIFIDSTIYSGGRMKKLKTTGIVILVTCILLVILFSLEFDIKPNDRDLSIALSGYTGESKYDVEITQRVYTDKYLYVLFQTIQNKNESGYGVFQKGINSQYRYVKSSYRSPHKLYSLYDKDVTIVYGIRLGPMATSYSIDYLKDKEIKTIKGTISDEAFMNVYEEKIDIQQIHILNKDNIDITNMVDTRLKGIDRISDRVVAESFMIYIYCFIVFCCGLYLIVKVNFFEKSMYKNKNMT